MLEAKPNTNPTTTNKLFCKKYFVRIGPFPWSYLVLRKRARYTILCAALLGEKVSGHRQVVRQRLPKPSCAGSNPVARSSTPIFPTLQYFQHFNSIKHRREASANFAIFTACVHVHDFCCRSTKTVAKNWTFSENLI